MINSAVILIADSQPRVPALAHQVVVPPSVDLVVAVVDSREVSSAVKACLRKKYLLKSCSIDSSAVGLVVAVVGSVLLVRLYKRAIPIPCLA